LVVVLVVIFSHLMDLLGVIVLVDMVVIITLVENLDGSA
jgi:hypothetical protein